MMIALIVFQTLLFRILPWPAPEFNVSLTGEVTISHVTPTITGHKVNQDSRQPETGYQIRTVVIDAGHGGHDPGCLGGHSREKHLALGIAKKLKAAFQRTYPEVRVIMTREEDVFVPLYQRAAIANRNQADLFISIHCNFMPGSEATRGSETYVMGLHTAAHNLNVAKRENAAILLEEDYEKNYDYDPNSPEGHIMLSIFQNAHLEQSILFADLVEKQIKAAGRRSRGVKQAGFVVLKETTMPSVLIEAGFLSNSREEAYLMSAAGQETLAGSILSAFTQYKEQVESPEYRETIRPLNEVATLPAEVETSTPVKPAPSSTPTPQPEAVPVKQEMRPEARKVYSNVWKPQKEPASATEQQNSSATVSRKAIPEAPRVDNGQVMLYVQLAASPRPQDTNQPLWQNLPYIIEVVKEDKLFKYRARNFLSIDEASKAREVLRQQGFSDAFLVAYKNGKRISLEQAQKELIRP